MCRFLASVKLCLHLWDTVDAGHGVVFSTLDGILYNASAFGTLSNQETPGSDPASKSRHPGRRDTGRS